MAKKSAWDEVLGYVNKIKQTGSGIVSPVISRVQQSPLAANIQNTITQPFQSFSNTSAQRNQQVQQLNTNLVQNRQKFLQGHVDIAPAVIRSTPAMQTEFFRQYADPQTIGEFSYKNRTSANLVKETPLYKGEMTKKKSILPSDTQIKNFVTDKAAALQQKIEPTMTGQIAQEATKSVKGLGEVLGHIPIALFADKYMNKATDSALYVLKTSKDKKVRAEATQVLNDVASMRGKIAEQTTGKIANSALGTGATTLGLLSGVTNPVAFLKFAGFTGTLGAGIGGIQGGGEGAKKGAIEALGRMPAIYGVVRGTDPFLAKGLQQVSLPLQKALSQAGLGNVAQTLVRRGLPALINLVQGVPIDYALGKKPLSKESLVIDLATGAFFGPGQFQEAEFKLPENELFDIRKALGGKHEGFIKIGPYIKKGMTIEQLADQARGTEPGEASATDYQKFLKNHPEANVTKGSLYDIKEPVTLYHGSNKSISKNDLNYGTYLTNSEQEAIDYANMRSGGRGGKPVISKFEFNPNEVKLNEGTGEYQFVGNSKSIVGGKYPPEVYKAYNDVIGGNLTKKEIDAMPLTEIRDYASQGFADGKKEFDKLVQPNVAQLPSGDIKTVVPQKLQGTQLPPEAVPASGISQKAPLKGKVNPPSQNVQPGSPSQPSVPQEGKISIGSTSMYNVGKNKGNQTILKQAIDEVKPEFEKVVGGPITHAEVIKNANEFSEDLIKTVGRKTTEEMGAAQLRLRQNIAALSDEGNVTPELLEKLKTDAAFARSTAQLFGQRAIEASPKTPAGKIKLSYLRSVLEVSGDMDKVLKAAKGVDFNDQKQATAFYREFIKPNIGDWVDKVRYNSMLTSPNTHVINITSNWQGTGVLTPIQKTIEGGIDATLSVFNPNRTRTRFAGEGAAYAKGYYNPQNVKSAFKNLWNVLSGKTVSEHPDARGIPLSTGGASRVVENILDVGGKALEGVDQLFKTLTTGGLEESAKYRAGKGVTKAATDTGKEASKLLFRGKLTEPGAGVISNAVGGFGEWVKRGTQSKQQVVRWTAKLTMPFMNIGTNLAKSGFEHNPVTGTLNMIGNQDKIAQAAKVIIGSAVVATAVPFAMSDRLTFKLPTGKEGDAAREAGMQDYSIKIGDKWVQYTKMHPALSWQLGMTASITDAMKNGKITEDAGSRLMEGAWAWLQFGLDQTYYKNVSDFMAGVNGNVERFASIPSNYASQFIPFRAFASWLNRMVDTYQRKPDTDAGIVTQSLQSIMRQLPGLSQMVPVRENKLGQPMKNENQRINAVSPFRISTEKPEMKQQYEDLRIINKINQEETATSKVETEQAQKVFDYFNTLPPKEAAQKYLELKKWKPSLAEKVVNIVKKGSKSVTEQSISSLGIESGGRAKFIGTKMKTMTETEKTAYVKDLIAKKLINAKVMQQLKEMYKRGEL